MVGNVLASFPINKSRAKEPLEEEPIPLLRKAAESAASIRIKAKMLGGKKEPTDRKTIIPSDEEIELVAPGMFRLPVSDDDETRKLERPEHKDAIAPEPLPSFDIESVDSFELVPSEAVTLETGKPARQEVPDWDDDNMATAELKAPEELIGDDSKSHISIRTSEILAVEEDEEDELKSPEELRRSTRPPMTGEVPESQPLFSLVPGISEERAGGDSSVNRSLKDLEELELERQLVELEEQEKRETEEKRAEFLKVLAERRKQLAAEEKAKKEAAAKAAADAAARAKKAAEEAKKAQEAKEAEEEAARMEAGADTTAEEIHVEVELGILWEDDHTIYRLTEDEVAICEPALPNRKRRYILPVPEKEDEGAEIVMAALKDEDRVQVAGKSYYIMDREFAGAKIVARVGNTINVWPHAMTNYEFLGTIGVDTPEYDEVEWPNSFNLKIRPDELEMVEGLIYEKRPILLHPVPAPYTQNPYNLKIMNDCEETPIVDIDGREYYVLEPETMERWREIVLTLKDVRMASRNGDEVSIWSKKINGHSLFSCGGTCHLASYGEPGAPLLPRGHEMTIEPYNAEALDIATVFNDGEHRRYLYPMPEKISSMDADNLNSLLSIAASYVEREKHSPLVSLRGRWYLAMEFPGVDNKAREAEYRDGVVKILKGKSASDGLAALSRMVQEKKEKREPPVVRLPAEPSQRVGLISKFPEHAIRYLVVAEPGLKSNVPDVWVRNGDGMTRYLVYEKEMPGSFAVVRTGDEIKPRK